MKSLKILLLLFPALFFSTNLSSFAEICFFGYQINSTDSVNEIYDDYSLTPNVGVIFGKNHAEFKETALALNRRGAKAIIMLNNMIFEKASAIELDCSDYGNVLKPGDDMGLRLIEDWKSTLSEFLTTEKNYLNSGKVLMIGIADEVNNACLPGSDIDAVANFIKDAGVTVPIGTVYDLSVLGPSIGRAKPLPESLPKSLDIVAIFEYGIFDPTDAENPLNATKDWDERWSNFKSKLDGRKVLIILNAFCHTRLHVQLGWVKDCTPEYVKPFTISAYRWRDWALSEPDLIGIVGFTWNSWNYPVSVGTKDMHKVVQKSHQNIINAINCDYDGQIVPIQ